MSSYSSDQIKNHIERYRCNVDPTTDTFNEIKTKIDSLLEFLDTKRYNIVTISKSLYSLHRQFERISRYKVYGNYKNLTETECDTIVQYAHNAILEFLKKPVEGFDIYLHIPLTNNWTVVSPKGYLWMIYGDTLKQIHVLGKYLLSVVEEEPTLLELKQAKEFADRLLTIEAYYENKSILEMIIEDKNFLNAYKKILDNIKKESTINGI